MSAVRAEKAAPVLDTAEVPQNGASEQPAPDPSFVDSRPTIVQALAGAAAVIGPVGKDRVNEGQGFKFRGVEDVTAAVAPAFQQFGIVVAPTVQHREVETILVGKFNNPWRLVSLTVRFRFHGPRCDHLNGLCDNVDATTVGEGFDPGDKASNKAMSGAYKYALVQTLTIAGDVHDDADADPSRPEPSSRQSQPQQAQRAQPPQRPQQPDTRPTETVEQIVARLTESHSAEHAAACKIIVDLLNEVPEAARSTTKEAFVDRFGNPWRLDPAVTASAQLWLGDQFPEVDAPPA